MSRRRVGEIATRPYGDVVTLSANGARVAGSFKAQLPSAKLSNTQMGPQAVPSLTPRLPKSCLGVALA